MNSGIFQDFSMPELTALMVVVFGAIGGVGGWILKSRSQAISMRKDTDTWVSQQFERLDARVAVLEKLNQELVITNAALSAVRDQLAAQVLVLRIEVERLSVLVGRRIGDMPPAPAALDPPA